MLRLTVIALIPLIALATLAASPSRVAAQDLFRAAGSPTLVPRDVALQGGGYVGEDADGWVYYANGLVCFHRDTPTVEHYLPEVLFNEGLKPLAFATMQPDGTGIELALTMRYPALPPQSREALRIYRFGCGDLAPGGASATRIGGEIMQADHPLLARGFPSAEYVRTSDGLCFVDSAPTLNGLPTEEVARVVCVDPDQDPPRVTELFDATELDGVLPVDPAWMPLADEGDLAISYGWRFSALASAPGGRLFFFVERSYHSTDYGTQGYHWVVERRADGAFRPRLGPFEAYPAQWGVTPLAGARRLVYSAELEAMVVGPIIGQDHNFAVVQGGLFGWTGIGLQVIPLDGPGNGYLPLSRPVIQRNRCPELPLCAGLAQTELVVGHAGLELAVRVMDANPNISNFEVFALSLRRAELDLDHDGLDTTAEAAAGTSEFLADSDGGGTPDALEVSVTGTDPLDQRGEPTARHTVKGWVRYVPSMLVDAPGVGKGVRSLAVDGPLCDAGVCHSPDGEHTRYPADHVRPGTVPVVARDGRSIMFETDLGLERLHFENGRVELAIARADFEDLIPCGRYALRVFPIDHTRTWLACEGHIDAGAPGEVEARRPARIAFADGGTPVIVYDHQEAQRDSGLTPAEDDQFEANDGGVMASITAIGWFEETGRFQLAVRGNWETYLIALTPDGAASLIGRGRGLKGMNTFDGLRATHDLYPPTFPTGLVPTGHGDYFADSGIMNPYNGFLPGYATGGRTSDEVVGAWGDTLFADGLELVRYEREVLPGDVLIMRAGLNGVEGAMLFKSGPRGGIVELWGPDPAIGNVAGMDLARDGSMRLCVADDVHEVVWEFAPAGPEGPPEIVRWVADVPFVRDCAYDDDGALRVLAVDHVAVRSGEFGDLVWVSEVPASPDAIELVRDAAGVNVVRAANGLRGQMWLADGREATMRDDDFTLRVEGHEDRPIPNLIYQTATIPRDPHHPVRVQLAERADGTIVVAPRDATPLGDYASMGRILLVDPRTGSVHFLGLDEYVAHHGVGLAVVPGGSAANPWTGRLPEGVEPDAPPVGPDPGPNAGAANDTPPLGADDGGCGAGGTPSALGLLVAVLFGRGWRRRSHHPTRAGVALAAALLMAACTTEPDASADTADTSADTPEPDTTPDTPEPETTPDTPEPDTTPQPPTWDPTPPPPACAFDTDTPLLDTTLARIGRTKATFGFAQSDLDQSGYETAGILADPFVLSWFKATRANPARLGCFEGEVAHTLDAHLEAPHPVASMIRHAARLLDREVDNTPPLDPNDLPGDFDQAIAALCALVPDAPCGPPRGLIDPTLRAALTPILWAIREVAAVQLERDADTSAGTPDFWQIHGGNLLLISLRGSTPDLANPAVRQYLLAKDHAPRLYAAAARLAFAIEHANLTRFADLAGNDFEVETPLGRVRVWDTTLQEHDDEPGALLLFVDTGGDDTYYGPIGATRIGTVNPVSVAIDLGGKDTYTYRSATPSSNPALLPADAAGRYGGDANYGPFSLSNVSRQGGARKGVAMLFDLGDGDDTFKSLTSSQGYAQHGVGVLFDAGGNDTYLAESTSQGAAQFGIGLHVDRGDGDDTYTSFTNSQGFGYVGGFGALVDGGGDDAYRCDHGDPNAGGFRLYYSPQMATDGNSSFCQGAGFGRRGTTPETHLSGGLGMLRDVSGDDTYEASVFAQGTGYWQATGILSDGDGDDTYDAYYYAQGGAAHYAIGLLSDNTAASSATDHDRFNTTRPGRFMHLGAGHDFSVGVLINERGDDTYVIAGLGAGASNCNGIGLFVDNAGNDTYQSSSDYGSGMGNVSSECLETRPLAASLGVMIDASGTDTYTYPMSDYPLPSDNTTWGHTRNDLPSEGGAGVDTEGQTGVHPGG